MKRQDSHMCLHGTCLIFKEQTRTHYYAARQQATSPGEARHFKGERGEEELNHGALRNNKRRGLSRDSHSRF